jgi:hypothetical protein
MGLQKAADCPCSKEKSILIGMVYNTNLKDNEKETVLLQIDACENYTHYQQLFFYLEDNQKSIHEIINPNQTDIKNHLRKFIK